jgi:hypothetical protein
MVSMKALWEWWRWHLSHMEANKDWESLGLGTYEFPRIPEVPGLFVQLSERKPVLFISGISVSSAGL